jgi:hypothetical protein
MNFKDRLENRFDILYNKYKDKQLIKDLIALKILIIDDYDQYELDKSQEICDMVDVIKIRNFSFDEEGNIKLL